MYYFIFTSTGQKNVERMIMMTLGQHAGLLIHWTNSTPDLVWTLASDWSHSAESSGDKRRQQMRFEIWHTYLGNKILAWGLSRHVWAKYSYRHDALKETNIKWDILWEITTKCDIVKTKTQNTILRLQESTLYYSMYKCTNVQQEINCQTRDITHVRVHTPLTLAQLIG